MSKPDQTITEMEKALLRLMPVAVSEGAQESMDAMLDELAVNAKVTRFDFRKSARWVAGAGIAAVLGLGVFLVFPDASVKSVSQEK